MSNTAISVEGLGKAYRIGVKTQKHETLATSMLDLISAPFRSFRDLKKLGKINDMEEGLDMIWALRNVTFTVNHGDVMGIIGRNGAGKSTLLKIFSRITQPTEGKVTVNGRIASLLEVGTGFHPDLSGRENIYLNGSILGMRKAEINKNFDEILAFSGVEKFIDTPVKRYSSGMKVRLAFSVAAHLNPEMLLIDEVLAVGDATFQKKCLAKMDDVAKGGRTVLFVSHQLGMVRSLCTRGVFLKGGQVEYQGEIAETLDKYENSLESRHGNKSVVEFPENPALITQMLVAEIMNEEGVRKIEFDMFEQVVFQFKYIIREPIEGMAFAIYVERNGETLFCSQDTDIHQERFQEREPGVYTTVVRLPKPLKPGRFMVEVTLGRVNAKHSIDWQKDVFCFDVIEKTVNTSLMSYALRRAGVIATELDWEITNREPLGLK